MIPWNEKSIEQRIEIQKRKLEKQIIALNKLMSNEKELVISKDFHQGRIEQIKIQMTMLNALYEN